MVLRSLFEASTNFSYLLIDPEKIEERANYYYVGFAIEEIKVCESTFKTRSTIRSPSFCKVASGEWLTDECEKYEPNILFLNDRLNGLDDLTAYEVY